MIASAHVTAFVQVGQVAVAHRPEQQKPPQHCEAVVQAAPVASQVGQVVLEHTPEQQSPLQHCDPRVQTAPVPLHVGGTSQKPAVQTVPEQHTPVVHDWPAVLQTAPLELEDDDDELEPELEVEDDDDDDDMAAAVPPLPPLEKGTPS